MMTDLADVAREQLDIDQAECFIDATFSLAKGRGAEVGATRRDKGLKS